VYKYIRIYKYIYVYIYTYLFYEGDYCSILIGYNNQLGAPVAGLIYRPLTEPATWAAGAKSGTCLTDLYLRTI
jgi:hypothetical protein